MRDFPHAACAVLAVPAGSAQRHHLRVAEIPDARPLSSAIAEALDDMCRELERYGRRQERRLSLARSVEAADRLIDDLRALVLAGEPAVPAGWRVRLDDLLAGLPPGVAGDLRTGGAPGRLLEELFAIEEGLFRLELD